VKDEELGTWSRNGNEYPDRESLMAAESNGWIVVSLFHDAQGSVAVYGPWPTQHEARNARGRIRTRHRKEFGEAVSYRVRPLWKESR
jgi:hypothetical protein